MPRPPPAGGPRGSWKAGVPGSEAVEAARAPQTALVQGETEEHREDSQAAADRSEEARGRCLGEVARGDRDLGDPERRARVVRGHDDDHLGCRQRDAHEAPERSAALFGWASTMN